MATNSVSPKKGKVVDIPTAPTIGTATAGGESATVAFTAATVGGTARTFTALSNPGSITGTGTSPITVSGLTAGTAYTFTVRGSNATGNGEYSAASNSVTPTVANSYESIQTVNVGSGGSTSISFSSIPGTYKHLQIRGIARVATSGDRNLRLFVNGDTTNSNYRQHWLYGAGSSATSENNVVSPQIGYLPMSGDTANIFGVTITDILDYTNTNKTKVVRSLFGWDGNGSTSGLLALGSGFQTSSTSAITSLTIQMATGTTIAQYSQFALYGIKG
jgi:hypothetical protein